MDWRLGMVNSRQYLLSWELLANYWETRPPLEITVEMSAIFHKNVNILNSATLTVVSINTLWKSALKRKWGMDEPAASVLKLIFRKVWGNSQRRSYFKRRRYALQTSNTENTNSLISSVRTQQFYRCPVFNIVRYLIIMVLVFDISFVSQEFAIFPLL